MATPPQGPDQPCRYQIGGGVALRLRTQAWLYGFLVTYDVWGGGGVVLGLILGLVGVVPLGIIGAALHGFWEAFGELIFGTILTIGAQLFAVYLTRKTEQWESAELAD